MALERQRPQIGKNVFVAPSAQIIGDVKCGADCSFWFNTVIRADVMPIEIGDKTNIQDGSIIHGTYKKAAARIGSRVTVGHGVILHGCKLEDLVLVGMGTIIMDDAHIESNCIIGAGSLVTEGTVIPEGSLVFGRPGRVVRSLSAEEREFVFKSSENYILYKEWYKKGVPCD